MRIERGNRRGKDSKKAEEKKKKKTSWNFEEEKICYALERSGVVGHKERIHHDSLTLRRMSFLRGKSSLRFSLLFKEIQDVALKKDSVSFLLCKAFTVPFCVVVSLFWVMAQHGSYEGHFIKRKGFIEP